MYMYIYIYIYIYIYMYIFYTIQENPCYTQKENNVFQERLGIYEMYRKDMKGRGGENLWFNILITIPLKFETNYINFSA